MNEPGAGLHDEAGFSLLETVVAFAILSLVMTTAIQIIGAGTHRTRMGQDRAIALAHAQSSLAGLGTGDSVRSGRSTGKYEDGFVWTLTVSPMSDADGLSPQLAEISVTPPGNETARVVLKTIVLGQDGGRPQ